MPTNAKKVKDLMVPIDQYPTVNRNALLEDAVKALYEGRMRMPEGRQPYRAVLVVDAHGAAVGKIGQLTLLKALEPYRHVAGDMGALRRAGVTNDYLDQAMEHSRIFQQELPDLCRSVARTPVHRVMHAVTEHIDENASIIDAIHSIVVWQTLSLLVTRGVTPVGLIRLDDLCDEVSSYILATDVDNGTDQ